MTDYIACGRVVPERIAAIVKGIAEACVEAGCALRRRRDRRAPRAAGARRLRRRGRRHRGGRGRRPARPGRVRPGDVGRWRWRPAACTPTATPWSATSCSSRRPAGRSTATCRRARPDPRRGAARADPDLRQGLPGARPRRPAVARDGARHRRRARRQPRARDARGAARSPSTARTWTPAPVFDVVRRVGGVPQADLEATLNCGVGMVALLAPDDVDAAVERARRARHRGLGRRRGRGRGRRRGGGRRAGRPAPRLVTLARRSAHGIGESGRVCGNSQPTGSVGATRTL